MIQTSPQKCTLDKIKILSGAQLKYIAFVSMLIDHVNKALIYPNLNGEGLLLKISNLFDVLGRIAFPIFAFLLVEGFFNTKNRKNLCSNGSEKTVTKLQNLILFYRISRKKQALFSSEAWGTFCLCVHFAYQNYEMARFYITILQRPKTRSRQMSFP